MSPKRGSNTNPLICAIDVGSTKVCALIAEVDPELRLRVIGASRVPAQGMRRGMIINTVSATAAIGLAISEAEAAADQVMRLAYVGITGSHINAIVSKGAVAVGRNGRSITKEDCKRALEQARRIALPHNRDIIHVVPRSYAVDDQRNIPDPVGMFGSRLEVEVIIITGASSAITNLVNCVQANGVEIKDLVLEPLASAEAVLTEDERRLGVALVDIGGGTTDMAIFLEDAPWHTIALDLGGDHFIRDVVSGFRMPYNKAEELIKQFGDVFPDRVPAEAQVSCGAFGQAAEQMVSQRALAAVLNARAEDVVDLILREVKRSGYDGLLPAGIVLSGGVAQLVGFPELSRERLLWPVRTGKPDGLASSVMDLSSPEYATSVGLLLWGLRRDTVPRVVAPPSTSLLERLAKWLNGFLPGPIS